LRLLNLIDGTPETLVGVPRQNHIDFYFLWDDIQSLKTGLPRPNARPNPALRLATLSSTALKDRGECISSFLYLFTDILWNLCNYQ
jgi:hypothetical protein